MIDLSALQNLSGGKGCGFELRTIWIFINEFTNFWAAKSGHRPGLAENFRRDCRKHWNGEDDTDPAPFRAVWVEGAL
jgi:hypothetical protein